MKQDTLDKFLKEISYKFPKGYPDMKDPNDVKLLNKLVMEYTDISEEEVVKLDEYDQIIADAIGDGKTYPKPTGAYKIGENGNVNSTDLKYYKELYYKGPKTTKGAEASKGSGHGEIAMYWLLQKAYPGQVQDNRRAGRDAADLKVGNTTLEVKAVGTKLVQYGRIGSEAGILGLLNVVFGSTAMNSAMDKENFLNDGSALGFTKDQLTKAVSTFDQLRQNEGLRALANGEGVPKIDFIAQMMNKMDKAYAAMGKHESAEEGAGKILLDLLAKKTISKMGGDGYLVDLTPQGSMKYHHLTLEYVKSLSPKAALDNIVVNQGQLKVNFGQLLSKEG
jgi:hypothetical protein